MRRCHPRPCGLTRGSGCGAPASAVSAPAVVMVHVGTLEAKVRGVEVRLADVGDLHDFNASVTAYTTHAHLLRRARIWGTLYACTSPQHLDLVLAAQCKSAV